MDLAAVQQSCERLDVLLVKPVIVVVAEAAAAAAAVAVPVVEG